MNRIKVNVITTWDIKCGIAAYSRFLKSELDKLDYIKINICPIEKPNSINPLYFIKLAKGAKRDCQIVHIQYQSSFFGRVPLIPFSISYFPLLISILRLRIRSKVITTIHEIYLGSRIDKWRLLKFINLSDKLIVHSDKLLEILIKNGVPKGKIMLVPHGTLKGEILSKEECKRKLDVSNKKTLALFGFIHQYTGHDLVIDILPKLDESVVLLVAGSPRLKEHDEYYNFLQRKVLDLNLKGRVKFLDFVKEEDLPIVFNATDIAIFPYRWIIVSGALHLVLGYKIPTIASDLDYFKEIESKYDCIELFKKNDKQDLFKKLQGLLNNKERQDYLKRKGEDFYEETSWENLAAKTVNLYLDVVAEHPDVMYEQEQQKERLDWLKINKEGITLEIGCATGFVANYVNASVGLDLRQDRILFARRKYPHIEFIRGDASTLPFDNNSFDTVLAPEILEHVFFETAKKILKECLRVCRKQILITMPNASKRGYKADRVIGDKNPEHLWNPTQNKIKELVKETRHKIEYSSDESFVLVKIWKFN